MLIAISEIPEKPVRQENQPGAKNQMDIMIDKVGLNN